MRVFQASSAGKIAQPPMTGEVPVAATEPSGLAVQPPASALPPASDLLPGSDLLPESASLPASDSGRRPPSSWALSPLAGPVLDVLPLGAPRLVIPLPLLLLPASGSEMSLLPVPALPAFAPHASAAAIPIESRTFRFIRI